MQQSNNAVPRHVGIILDGNRRFAKRLMLKPWKGHEWGAKKVHEVLDWAFDAGIQELTLYSFSIENFDRPKEEFDYLMRIFKQELDNLLTPQELDKMRTRGVRVTFIGRTSMFDSELQEKMAALMAATANNSPRRLNMAMAYGGRAEIIDAVKKLAEQVRSGQLDVAGINEQVFAKQLYTDSEPDLVIRTSGEQRTSGFMLWQGSYAELYFCPKMWPEFEKEDFMQALAEYANRDRRFGK
ncbi:di-trans,poly-cis-decaprenylcistransferase [Candidatus Woesearchaeota archaeon]|nr:di-trans,poly-cis-decaprenylcistransferase [Candidatus Woesearchaeota archaeon]